jgi:GNAT superfamily N-acetyltransferase
MSSFKPIVSEAKTDEEIPDCHQTIKELMHPNLSDKDEYLSRVRRQQKNHNYRLMFVRDENGSVVSILGFRIQEFLWSGMTLYVDDFATLSTARGKGFGHILMEWAINYAKECDCEQITLDSSYPRNDAHRFYLNHGFKLTSHHFAQKLK